MTVGNRQHTVKPENVRSPSGDALSGLAFRVLRVSGLLSAAGDQLAKPAGQSSARWQVLAAAQDAPRSVAQIARALGLARQSVQRIADLLVDEGLAAYEDNPDHRRAKLVRLTRTGGGALRKIQSAQRTWADTLGAQLDETEVRRASALLDRLAILLTGNED
jgi:DNA-binding MarR family transcriptional regulator